MAATTKTDVAQVLDLIKGMTIVEVADLVKMIEEEFGVTAVVPVVQGAGVAQATEGAAVEEKTSFTVILKSGGSNKIPVIKEVRGIIGLGLKETKELVEAGNKPIKENVTKKEAEEIKKKLEELGASVELQ